MWKFPKLPFYASVGAIPESYLLSLSYEEQILWLCSQVQAIKEGTPNYNYELLENKPSINNIPLIGNLTPEQLGLSNDYNIISNKPLINGVIISGNKSGTDYGLQNQLIAGTGISIVGNTISATGGGGGGGATSYNQLSDKPSINLVTIEGHMEGEDLGLQNELNSVIVEGAIDPNLVIGSRFDFSSVSLNDIVLEGEPPAPLYNDLRIVDDDGAYIILNAIKGSSYRIRGNFSLLKIDENNVAKVKYSTDNEYSITTFTSLTDGRLLISFDDVLNASPKIVKLETGEGIEEANKKQNIEDKINKDNIDTFLMQNGTYETLNLSSGIVSEIDSLNKLVDVSQQNTASFLLDIVTYPIYNRVNLKGYAMDKYMIIYADSNRNVLGKEPKNLAYYGDYVYLNIPKGTKYIAFNFYDVSNHPAEVKIYRINSIAESSSFYTEIDQNLVLNYDGTTNVTLESGKYYRLMPTRSLAYYKDVSGTPTLDSAIDMKNSILYYYATASSKSLTITGINEHNDEYIKQELFWINSSNGWFYSTLKTNEVIQNGVSSIPQRTRSSIPSSGQNNDVPTIEAVRNYVTSLEFFYTEIDQNVTLNLDGTSTYNFESNKYYLLKPNCHIYYYDSNNTLHSAPNMEESIFYYEEDYSGSTLTQKVITRTGINKDMSEVSNESIHWTPENNYWYHSYSNYLNYVGNGYPSHISSTKNSIPASGSDYGVPTIKAVRDYIDVMITQAIGGGY